MRAKTITELLEQGGFNKTRHWDLLPASAQAAYTRAGGGGPGRAAALRALDNVEDLDRFEELAELWSAAVWWRNECDFMAAPPDTTDAVANEYEHRNRVMEAIHAEFVQLSHKLMLDRPRLHHQRDPAEAAHLRAQVIAYATQSA